MNEIEYKNFFKDFFNFKNIQNQQKARGLNDFNLLTTVLNYHDEVRLHSRMIGSLLDSNAKHYQGTLFLEIFLKKIGLDNWFENLKDIKVSIEYEDIDLYLSDGIKHLIIENKIWAGDQPCQIIKYINIIVEENKGDFHDFLNDTLDENLLRVIYLTPQMKDVSLGHQLEERGDAKYISFTNNNDLIHCSRKMRTNKTIDFDLKNYKAWYKKITYKDYILPWLEKCQNEVRNITNLSESIKQYITVVDKVNKDYKGNVMSIQEHIFQNKNNIKAVLEIDREIDNVKGKILFDFFDKSIRESILNNIEYTIYDGLLPSANQLTEQKCLNSFKKSKNAPKHYGLVFDCQFGTNKYFFIKVAKTGLYYGVICSDEIKIKIDKEQKLEKFYFCNDKLNKIFNPKYELCAKHFGDIKNIEQLIEPDNIIKNMINDIDKIKNLNLK